MCAFLLFRKNFYGRKYFPKSYRQCLFFAAKQFLARVKIEFFHIRVFIPVEKSYVREKKLKKPVAIVCPLNWGLGHASRSALLISECMGEGFDVVVAASGNSLEFLKLQFGQKVEYLHYPGMDVSYGKGRWAGLKLMCQAPRFMFSIWKEYRWMQKTVSQYSPSVILSDNRYGARSPRCTSILITHQLQVRFPVAFLQKMLNTVNRWLISGFNQCWVPDHEYPPTLAGELSRRKTHKNIHYIGLLTRFESLKDFSAPWWYREAPKAFILVLISGPEPQRTIFEQAIKAALTDHPVVGFRGIPAQGDPEISNQQIWLNHANDTTLAWCLKQATMVICRSGYSTLMDLAWFNKKALVIATPGQPEQEYLACWLSQNNWAISLKQAQIHQTEKYIEKVKGTLGITLPVDPNLRQKLLREIKEARH